VAERRASRHPGGKTWLLQRSFRRASNIGAARNGAYCGEFPEGRLPCCLGPWGSSRGNRDDDPKLGMGDGTLDIVARIPALPAGTAASSRPPVAEASPAGRSPRRAPRFPLSSVIMLAILAAGAWAAAAWREQVRLARQRPPARWAEAFAEDPPAADGVVR
jgi:hypothetical protein